MDNKNMSDYEVMQVHHFISEIYAIQGNHVEKDEWISCAWIKYLELRKQCGGTIFLFYDWNEIYLKLIHVMAELKKVRNQKISLESEISLNETYGDGEPPVEGWMRKRQGDFVNHIALWDYMKRLGYKKYRILKLLYYQESDAEIIERLQLCIEDYRQIKSELSADFEMYLRMG